MSKIDLRCIRDLFHSSVTTFEKKSLSIFSSFLPCSNVTPNTSLCSNRCRHIIRIDLNNIVIYLFSSAFRSSSASGSYPGAITPSDTSRLDQARCINVTDVRQRNKVTERRHTVCATALLHKHMQVERALQDHLPSKSSPVSLTEEDQQLLRPVIHA